MISGTSYLENISREENKHYDTIVRKLVHTGEIEPKYRLLLDIDSIYNIAMLSFMYMECEINRPTEMHKQSVIDLFALLGLDDRHKMLCSLGIEFVINFELDEIKEVHEAMMYMAFKLYPKLSKPTLRLNPNTGETTEIE